MNAGSVLVQKVLYKAQGVQAEGREGSWRAGGDTSCARARALARGDAAHLVRSAAQSERASAVASGSTTSPKAPDVKEQCVLGSRDCATIMASIGFAGSWRAQA